MMALTLPFCQHLWQNMTMPAHIDKFGRVVIPKALRRRLGLQPGTAFNIATDDNSIIITPVTAEPPLHIEDDILVYSATATDDLEAALQDLRDDRIATISGPLINE
ncbi:MAG: AbrB/MazE/SpoVT family DNA-binding domain-containing protein [Candidatus Dadabacteria bacterium]|nr:MAG: AbrB/MazE/SpoVT family DNA-binding domain-containing protein [Candidatus Dadabacteria bacterium]